MNRQQCARIAQETLNILTTGSYDLPDGRSISISDALTRACDNTILYRPTDYDALLTQCDSVPHHATPTITVSNQTTLTAARALHAEYPALACLNFASAKNAGGGFLSGSQAQEESLARASGLYATLQTQPDFMSTTASFARACTPITRFSRRACRCSATTPTSCWSIPGAQRSSLLPP